MASSLQSSRWLTGKNLHQIQILSCDLCDFEDWDCSDHCAPFWRLYWHEGSGGQIGFGSTVVDIQPGHLVLVPPNTHFSSRLSRPFRQLFVHFIVEPYYRAFDSRAFDLIADSKQSELCGQITRQLESDPVDIRVSFLCQMLVASALLAIPAQGWSRCFDDPRITRAVGLLSETYPEWIGNAALSRNAGMHSSSFIRLFRRCTGCSPMEYHLNLRLEEACRMLHFDEASIDEVAEKTGFSERSYFTRVFSRHMNCTPARYRNLVNVCHRQRP